MDHQKILIFLHYDASELFEKFSQTIKHAILERSESLDIEAGFMRETAPTGFAFCDDNLYLFTLEMYEIYGYPMLKAAFERYSPNPGDTGVPALRFRNGSSSTTSWDLKHDWLQNFGPTLTVEEIHRHMPTACIDGQISPFTFMNNDSEKITAEVKRDCEMAKEHQ